MHEPATALHTVDLASLGERLSAMRLCDAASLTAMRNSLAQHGQLTAPTVFGSSDQLEILDGFKRARAARALGWPTLLARVDPVDSVEAKLRVCALHDSRSLTELEEGWLVRSLYREDGLSLPEIARRMVRHRSWVWRRLMLVESLDASVQADVRLGLLAARAAVAVSRLPRGNQQAASTVVMRRGLTVRQTELLVDEVLCVAEPDTAAALLARRLEERSLAKIPGPRSTRAVRNEADWMSADILKAHTRGGVSMSWRTREELAHQVVTLKAQGTAERAIARAVSRNTVSSLLRAHALGDRPLPCGWQLA
jgi:ParB-like chromosome segregation protein Spo0J